MPLQDAIHFILGENLTTRENLWTYDLLGPLHCDTHTGTLCRPAVSAAPEKPSKVIAFVRNFR